MRTNCCHRFLAFNIKFLNFFQFFIGISTVIYSAYLLNQWQTYPPFFPPSPSPSPPSPPPPPPPPPVAPAPGPGYFISLYTNNGLLDVGDQIDFVNVAGVVSGSDWESGFLARLNSTQLPAPWFIYFLMVVGIVLCCMSCIGHIAAEAINGCCLCFYIFLEVVIILLEAALVAFIAIDKGWEKDIPFDQTGELEKLKSFFEKNADICKWLGVALVTVQALSLLLSLVLRAILSNRREDSDVENDFVAAGDRIREPLLNSQPNQSSGLTKGEGRGTLSDAWTTRMRQKYGLNNDSSKQQSSNASSSMTT